MDCLTGNERTEADLLLAAIVEDGRLEYLCTNDDCSFIENCQNTKHIHWPTAWLETLRGIAATLGIE